MVADLGKEMDRLRLREQNLKELVAKEQMRATEAVEEADRLKVELEQSTLRNEQALRRHKVDMNKMETKVVQLELKIADYKKLLTQMEAEMERLHQAGVEATKNASTETKKKFSSIAMNALSVTKSAKSVTAAETTDSKLGTSNAASVSNTATTDFIGDGRRVIAWKLAPSPMNETLSSLETGLAAALSDKDAELALLIGERTTLTQVASALEEERDFLIVARQKAEEAAARATLQLRDMKAELDSLRSIVPDNGGARIKMTEALVDKLTNEKMSLAGDLSRATVENENLKHELSRVLDQLTWFEEERAAIVQEKEDAARLRISAHIASGIPDGWTANRVEIETSRSGDIYKDIELLEDDRRRLLSIMASLSRAKDMDELLDLAEAERKRALSTTLEEVKKLKEECKALATERDEAVQQLANGGIPKPEGNRELKAQLAQQQKSMTIMARLADIRLALVRWHTMAISYAFTTWRTVIAAEGVRKHADVLTVRLEETDNVVKEMQKGTLLDRLKVVIERWQSHRIGSAFRRWCMLLRAPAQAKSDANVASSPDRAPGEFIDVATQRRLARYARGLKKIGRVLKESKRNQITRAFRLWAFMDESFDAHMKARETKQKNEAALASSKLIKIEPAITVVMEEKSVEASPKKDKKGGKTAFGVEKMAEYRRGFELLDRLLRMRSEYGVARAYSRWKCAAELLRFNAQALSEKERRKQKESYFTRVQGIIKRWRHFALYRGWARWKESTEIARAASQDTRLTVRSDMMDLQLELKNAYAEISETKMALLENIEELEREVKQSRIMCGLQKIFFLYDFNSQLLKNKGWRYLRGGNDRSRKKLVSSDIKALRDLLSVSVKDIDHVTDSDGSMKKSTIKQDSETQLLIRLKTENKKYQEKLVSAESRLAETVAEREVLTKYLVNVEKDLHQVRELNRTLRKKLDGANSVL